MPGDTEASTSQTLIGKLDIGDPLYLHPSDSSALTIVSIKLKGTENYSVWSSAMKLALEAKNKYGFIDGKCVKPGNDSVLASQWDRCNSVVLTWLLNSVSEELFLGQVYSKLASEVWTDLKESFCRVDGSVVYDLYKKINSVSQNGTTVAEYYNKLTTMWKQFDAMLHLPTCSCQAAKEFNDFSTLIKLMQFLMGLDDVYQSVRTNLLTREPLPTVKVAFSIISREESHRMSSTGSKSQNVSFVSKPNQTFDPRRKGNRGSNTVLKCSHCNMLGHTVDRCFEIIGYPPGFKRKSNNNNQTNKTNFANSNKANSVTSMSSTVGNSGLPFTPEQIAKLLSLVGEKSGSEVQNQNAGGEDSKSKRVLMSGRQDCGLYFVGNSVYLINRLPSYVLNGRSPYEMMFEFKPSLLHLRNFGCLCFSTVLHDSDKFSSNAEKCVLLGYSNFKKGYKLWSLDSKKVFFSRDVKFYESVFPFQIKNFDNQESVYNKQLNHANFFDNILSEVSNIPNDEEGANGSHDPANEGQQPLPPSTSAPVQQSEQEGSSGLDADVMADHITGSNVETNQSEGVSVRKSSRNVSMPKRFDEFVVEGKVKYGIEKVVSYAHLSYDNKCFVAALNKVCEPTCYNEAAKNDKWVDAMNSEMEALYRNNTWILVDLPKGRKPIGCKWVYKVKYKANGEVERYKARLVAKGFNQREGLDFGETFSPVVKMTTVRVVLKIAVNNGWPLYQMDVNNAFLYGMLSEDVYMVQPQGYSSNDNKVCKLVKSLYGLKQAPRQWNEKLTSVLTSMGFVQSMCDYSLFILSKSDVFVVLLVYVDDIVITGNNKAAIERVKNSLRENFHIKDLGLLRYFLGIEVLYSENSICLSQRKYCLELLNEFGYLGCKPVTTPIEQSFLVTNKCKNDQKILENVNGFQRLIGKLIYLSLTRPDISYTVQFLSQFMHSPCQSHLDIALRLLRYLKLSPGKGISFKKSDSMVLTGFVDSDWAKCLKTRKSVTGYGIFLGETLISWKSKKQSVVSRSTAEAEYRAMCSATCEIMWILNVLSELKVDYILPVSLYCDSKSAISISQNPVFHERTKHFELDLHFLREKIAAGLIKPEKISTEKQVADIFTKGLNAAQHQALCEKLCLENMFAT
ncbi:putative RNA-directed DNA polymerase [Helianthus annuus]|nr:putative RNA-directed DNA polymerase [Helianthus annuus]KAJ0911003.1 putative RNA-directed DNA polymerase [Helianthus annuus]